MKKSVWMNSIPEESKKSDFIVVLTHKLFYVYEVMKRHISSHMVSKRLQAFVVLLVYISCKTRLDPPIKAIIEKLFFDHVSFIKMFKYAGEAL